MLNCVKLSQADKTSGIAVTYRAGGSGETFGTCPANCMLKPEGETGTVQIDREYERAVRHAVPRAGMAWLYTHFNPSKWAELNQAGRTVFNYSAPSALSALEYFKQGIETVALVPFDYWERLAKGPQPSNRNFEIDGVTYVRCPAEYLPQMETDGDKSKRFARSLPPRSLLRHHVAGDIGAPPR